ncbi:MAG: riboflavin synthase [Actinobacteria bacterium]|nr:riboflavin synthase [Actinomycetota bacterium]
MFTGIIRELGILEALDGDEEGVRLRVRAPQTAAGTATGDSVALNGVCLTATDVSEGVLTFEAVPETLRRTSLGRLAAGAGLNVEPALRAGDPVGGHIVQGHVDGVGRVISAEPEGEGRRLEVEIAPDLARYVVERGSITLEGVSLTVIDLVPDRFAVALVPHTLGETTLGRLEPGDEVNIEVDVLAKHVERLLEARGQLG